MATSLMHRSRRLPTTLGGLRDASPRAVRFACTGGLAGCIQLALLHLWTSLGWAALLANGVAFLIAAQANFLMSMSFTWGDRPDAGRPRQTLRRRWLVFHGSITGTALLNQAVFAVARTALPLLVAAGFGIAVAAVINYALCDRLVFRARPANATGDA